MTLITCYFIDFKPKAEAVINNGEDIEYNFDQIYNWNGIEKVNSKADLKNNYNEKSSRLPTDDASEEFQVFFDSNTNQEVNLLTDSNEQLQFDAPFEIMEKTNSENWEVNLSYRGNKHRFEKGKNAERRDVLYKNFIRATRRYLWSLFEKEFDTSLMPIYKPSELFKQNVKNFYEKYFKQYADNEITSNEEDEKEILLILSTILTNKYSFPYKTDKDRKIMAQFESINQKFSKISYEKFFILNNISEIFNMFIKSGVVNQMIDAYPKLSESRDSYLKTAKSIVDFKTTKTLMK